MGISSKKKEVKELIMKCINCGNEPMRLRRVKKTPAWAIAVVIVLFPFGLLALLAKKEENIFRCDNCGYTYKEEI